jgi:hypothetical protein
MPPAKPIGEFPLAPEAAGSGFSQGFSGVNPDGSVPVLGR